MKKVLSAVIFTIVSVGTIGSMLNQKDAKWLGVDEAVVSRFAENAGRAPEPLFQNIAQGDILLSFFLIAGANGGFIAGYVFRGLFPPTEPGGEMAER